VLGKFRFHLNLTGSTGTLHEDQSTVLNMYCSVLLRMRNISGTSYRENQNTFYVQ